MLVVAVNDNDAAAALVGGRPLFGLKNIVGVKGSLGVRDAGGLNLGFLLDHCRCHVTVVVMKRKRKERVEKDYEEE